MIRNIFISTKLLQVHNSRYRIFCATRWQECSKDTLGSRFRLRNIVNKREHDVRDLCLEAAGVRFKVKCSCYTSPASPSFTLRHLHSLCLTLHHTASSCWPLSHSTSHCLTVRCIASPNVTLPRFHAHSLTLHLLSSHSALVSPKLSHPPSHGLHPPSHCSTLLCNSLSLPYTASFPTHTTLSILTLHYLLL